MMENDFDHSLLENGRNNNEINNPQISRGKKLLNFRFSGQTIIQLVILWPVIFIPICFILFFSLHHEYYYSLEGYYQVPTISVSGSLTPSSEVFTYGLHLEAVLWFIFFIILFNTYQRKIDLCEVLLNKNTNSNQDKLVEGGLIQEVILQNQLLTRESEVEDVEGEEGEEKRNNLAANGQPVHSIQGIRSGNDVNEKKGTTTMLSRAIKAFEFFTFYGCVCCYQYNKPFEAQRFHQWNKACFVFGAIACFCMSIVGSVNLNLQGTVHSFFALLMFFFGILHVLCFYYNILRLLPIQQDLSLMLFHQLCLFFLVPFNIIVSIITGIVYYSCDSRSCTNFVKDMFPCLEFTTIVFLLVYALRFYEEFRYVDLQTIFLANPQKTLIPRESYRRLGQPENSVV